MTEAPLRRALGTKLADLDPLVRDHFGMPEGERLYRGVMRRIWRRGGLLGALLSPLLRMTARNDTLFPETGSNVPFELYHSVSRGGHNEISMIWARTFRFPDITRRFDAIMVYSEERECLVDWLGVDGRLEVELHATTEGAGLRLRSGRQWLRVGGCKVGLPEWLVGRADVLETRGPTGDLNIMVAVENPLVGQVMGYEGYFSRVDEPVGDGVRDSIRVPSAVPLVPLGRWTLLALAALLGTAAYASSFRAVDAIHLRAFAGSVGLSAGTAWVLFMATLAVFAPLRSGLGAWVGLSLRTMMTGIAVLGLGVALNLSPVSRSLEPRQLWLAHLVILVVADLTMGATFILGARAGRLGAAPAFWLWGLVLNGLFALAFWFLGSPW